MLLGSFAGQSTFFTNVFIDSDTRIISFHTHFHGIVYYMTLNRIQSGANSDTILIDIVKRIRLVNNLNLYLYNQRNNCYVMDKLKHVYQPKVVVSKASVSGGAMSKMPKKPESDTDGSGEAKAPFCCMHEHLEITVQVQGSHFEIMTTLALGDFYDDRTALFRVAFASAIKEDNIQQLLNLRIPNLG
ncbi:hypothetical protein ACJX0J_037164 [Zea mays]